MQATAPAPLDVETLRADFPILSTKVHGNRDLVYFDNAASTQRPRAVIDCLENAYESCYANVHRGIHWLSEQSTDRYEQAREKSFPDTTQSRTANSAHAGPRKIGRKKGKEAGT